MKITPCGYRVLIKQDILEEKDETYSRARAAGIVLAENDDFKREQLGVDTGVVISIGPDAWENADQPWAKVGDRVAFAKHTGKMFRNPDDEKDIHLIFEDQDIIAVIGDDE